MKPRPASSGNIAGMSSLPISNDQVETLDRLLQLRAVPFGGFGVEGLDGYMTALQLGPGSYAAADAFEAAWGRQPPRWEGEADRAEALALFETLWRTVERRLRAGGEELPPELLPIWWLPEDPMVEHPDDVAIGAAWAEGFRLGMEREAEGWESWLADGDWLHEALALIDDIELGNTIDEEGSGTRPLRYRERLETFAVLPDVLYDLQQLRIERLSAHAPIRVAPTPGRNDPCPCGSGAKFKKCCGAGC
jgi:uncharacterized protein